MRKELSRLLPFQVESCSTPQLLANPGLAAGALVVSTPGQTRKITHVLPKSKPPLPLQFSDADAHIRKLSDLTASSVIAVASVSRLFLKTAKAVLGPSMGGQHALVDLYVEGNSVPQLGAVDLAFCDALAFESTKSRKAVYYQLVSSRFIEDATREMTLR